jgi:DNA-binding GntR family transcriptional regulator
MSDVAAAGQLHDYLQLVAQFHEIVRSACPNAALVDLIGGLSRRSMRFRAVSIRTPSRVATSLNSHRELLAALQQRDAEPATELTRAILTTSRDAIVASLREGNQAPGVSAEVGTADSTAA